MPQLFIDSKTTPYGRISVACSQTHLCAAGFGKLRRLDLLPGYQYKTQSTPLTRKALAQITAYLTGTQRQFTLPLHIQGTPFQRQVWQVLQKISYGQTLSYGDVAKRIGKPKAARAVGMACNRNRIGLVIPCHRVIGSSGALTGYAGGLKHKAKLLQLEQA